MKKCLIVLSAICLIASIVIFCVGNYKITEYQNNSASCNNVNAYVGGDAYNLIINGNLFTGYNVIAGSFLIVAAIFFSGAGIITAVENNKEKKYSSEIPEDVSPNDNNFDTKSQSGDKPQKRGTMIDYSI